MEDPGHLKTPTMSLSDAVATRLEDEAAAVLCNALGGSGTESVSCGEVAVRSGPPRVRKNGASVYRGLPSDCGYAVFPGNSVVYHDKKEATIRSVPGSKEHVYTSVKLALDKQRPWYLRAGDTVIVNIDSVQHTVIFCGARTRVGKETTLVVVEKGRAGVLDVPPRNFVSLTVVLDRCGMPMAEEGIKEALRDIERGVDRHSESVKHRKSDHAVSKEVACLSFEGESDPALLKTITPVRAKRQSIPPQKLGGTDNVPEKRAKKRQKKARSVPKAQSARVSAVATQHVTAEVKEAAIIPINDNAAPTSSMDQITQALLAKLPGAVIILNSGNITFNVK